MKLAQRLERAIEKERYWRSVRQRLEVELEERRLKRNQKRSYRKIEDQIKP